VNTSVLNVFCRSYPSTRFCALSSSVFCIFILVFARSRFLFNHSSGGGIQPHLTFESLRVSTEPGADRQFVRTCDEADVPTEGRMVTRDEWPLTWSGRSHKPGRKLRCDHTMGVGVLARTGLTCARRSRPRTTCSCETWARSCPRPLMRMRTQANITDIGKPCHSAEPQEGAGQSLRL
jgi:hypothetical protein